MGKNIYSMVNELLLSGQKLILAKTIRRSGSTPRDVGSMCIITEDGKMIGTVGGGLMEYRIRNRAKELFNKGQSFIYRFRLTDQDMADTSMICGGNVDLYLEPLVPENAETVSIFQTIKKYIDQNMQGTLITEIKNGINASNTGSKLFIKNDGTILGKIPGINVKEMDIDKHIACELVSVNENGSCIFVERIGLNPELIVFGAGHVSTFVVQLAKMVGFKIIVIDDRPEFANTNRFPDADEIIVSGFKQSFGQLNISKNSYIVIITRGHLYDKVVLQHALGTGAAYIGMIGSIKKRNTIYRVLMDEGFSKKDLEKVYSPIGIDINAETPEEIAVSIIGELIKKKSSPRKHTQVIL